MYSTDYSIIKFNKNQTHKKSWTDNVEGDLVSVSEFNNKAFSVGSEKCSTC